MKKDLPKGKLVRDGVPDIIRDQGQEPSIIILESDEIYISTLDDKLQEETTEFLEADTPEKKLEEAADILEVVLARIAVNGYTADDLEAARLTKARARGGFSDRVFLRK